MLVEEARFVRFPPMAAKPNQGRCSTSPFEKYTGWQTQAGRLQPAAQVAHNPPKEQVVKSPRLGTLQPGARASFFSISRPSCRLRRMLQASTSRDPPVGRFLTYYVFDLDDWFCSFEGSASSSRIYAPAARWAA